MSREPQGVVKDTAGQSGGRSLAMAERGGGLGCLASDQQLAEDVKISAENSERQVTGKAHFSTIAAAGQAVARLQRPDRGFDTGVSLPGLAELHGGLLLLLLCLAGSRLGQARMREDPSQILLVLGRMKPAVE